MQDKIAVEWALVALASKTLLIACSILFGYWGYRLFTQGIYDKQGELRASYHGAHLMLRQFGPGLGFAAIAVTFSLFAVFRPVSVEISHGTEPARARVVSVGGPSKPKTASPGEDATEDKTDSPDKMSSTESMTEGSPAKSSESDCSHLEMMKPSPLPKMASKQPSKTAKSF